MDTIILQDFRCFAGRHEIPLRPLTVLVGENSTGKTSLLAAVRALCALPVEMADFNRAPFQLGAFNEIANYRGGKAGRAPEFQLGFIRDRLSITVPFQNESAQPRARQFVAEFPSGHRILVKNDLRNIDGFLADCLDDEKLTQEDKIAADQLNNFMLTGLNPFVSAPIRAEPKRTYELTSDLPQPHGSHVPVILSQIYGQKEWDQVAAPLLEFAKAAGLFSAIKVRRLGKSESDPFQLQVQHHGPLRNIIDMGYGVSQILPLIFELIRGGNGRLFMVQQPEVHLHPRAQAELGSLFGALVKSQSKRFMIETHSDYIIDRIRMDIRDKKSVRPKDVMILFFEMQSDGAHVHSIEIDEQGNLVNAPPTYRQFFLEEERRFLGI